MSGSEAFVPLMSKGLGNCKTFAWTANPSEFFLNTVATAWGPAPRALAAGEARNQGRDRREGQVLWLLGPFYMDGIRNTRHVSGIDP